MAISLRSCVANIIVPCLLAQPSVNEPTSPAPTFGTTVVIPDGLHGSVYFIPKHTTVLPDFEHDRVKRVGEIWTNQLNIQPRHWRAGFRASLTALNGLPSTTRVTSGSPIPADIRSLCCRMMAPVCFWTTRPLSTMTVSMRLISASRRSNSRAGGTESGCRTFRDRAIV